MAKLILPSDVIVPSTRRILRLGTSTHRLEDDRVTIGLAHQLNTEYGQSWYAMATFSNGRVFCFGRTDTSDAPPVEVLSAMLACAYRANLELHHDGCWIVIWHLDRLSFMWRDGDGDAQFLDQVDEPWDRARLMGVDNILERIETAWQTWHEMMFHQFERKPEETIKRALGQQPHTSRSVH